MALYSGGDIFFDVAVMGELEGRSPGHPPVIMQPVEDRGAAVFELRVILDIGTPDLWSLHGDE